MRSYSCMPSLCGMGLLALTACTGPTAAVASSSMPAGIDLGSSSRATSTLAVADASAVAGQMAARHDARHPPSADVQLVHDGHADAHAVGVVNAVDTAQRKINLTHEPIPSIGWPSMTMDFPVAPSVDLTAIKPGARVGFTIEKGKGGMYEVQSVQPAGARR